MAAGDSTAATRLAKPSPSVVKATEADDGSGHAGDMGAVADCKGTMTASRVGDDEGNVMEMNGSSADFVA